MSNDSNSPLIGVFSKQLDNWTSGSGHHLNEIMQRVLDRNEKGPRYKFVFIHYTKSTNPIYQRVEELIIPRNPLAASRILRKRRFDILHYTPLTIFAPIFGVKTRKVATIHGAEQLIVPQFYGAIEMLHERFLVPCYARRMDHIITVSHTSRGYFMGRYGVPGNRITVCYNAVSPLYRVLPSNPVVERAAAVAREGSQRIPESDAVDRAMDTLSRVGLSAGDPYLFHLSRFSERKNPWTILEGFRRFLDLPAPAVSVDPPLPPGAVATKCCTPRPTPEVPSSAPVAPSPSPFKLVIGGTRWDNLEVERFLDRAGLREKVIRTGFLKEEETVAFYNFAAAFLFPSLAEGFGMPNLEAMACGCPVITSNVFAIPEVVGDAAIVLKNPLDAGALANAIQQVVYEPLLRKELIERGFHRVQLFDWEESARKVLEVYEGLVKTGDKR